MFFFALLACRAPDYAAIEAGVQAHAGEIAIDAEGCRGIERVLAGESPRGCAPGPLQPDGIAARPLYQRLAHEPPDDPVEVLWLSVNAQRSGHAVGWALAVQAQRRLLDPEPTPELCAAIRELAPWRLPPRAFVHTIQWENGTLVLAHPDDDAARAWLAWEDAYDEVKPWTSKSLAELDEPSGEAAGIFKVSPLIEVMESAEVLEARWGGAGCESIGDGVLDRE